MRVSEYFKLNKTQPYLDFVDIRLDTDTEVFVDPSALRQLNSPWGHECASLVQSYFETVLSRIRAGNNKDALSLLSCLNERNEFHLGFSKGKSRGHAFGEKSAETVWGSLSKSQASISGLLQDLEDTCLLIEGIGKDMISDAVCNILRGPLIRYTQDMCSYYGIPVTPGVASGPIWNPEREIWESSFVSLPMTNEGKVILIPKVIVRLRLSYRYDEYYSHYLLPVMQREEIEARTGLVHFLKDGTPRVTKKSLRAKYGADKLAVVEQTLKRPTILEKYKAEKEEEVNAPLVHELLSDVEATDIPDWSGLLAELQGCKTGRDYASQYEEIIERILSALFYPSLCHPQKQHKIHGGRKRIDITYSNEARSGFFNWVSLHYPSAFIFVECKNYGKEIGNPELDQLAGRFSPSRGKVGMLVFRSIDDAERLFRSCKDTAGDDRGFILTLTDAEIEQLLLEAQSTSGPPTYQLLKDKFSRLVS